MITIGIDPGISGAIAILKDGKLIDAFDMPIMPMGVKGKKNQVNAAGLVDNLHDTICRNQGECQVVIERVSAMPGQGVTSMFSFGMSYGVCLGVCAALNLPITYVTPQAWKKKFGLSGAEKDASRTKVIEMFPQQSNYFARKKDHGRADAVLIALSHEHEI